MVSKINNPRLSHLVKYGKFAASICAAKKIGSTLDSINITQNANDCFNSQLRAIDEKSYMKEKEKKAAGLQAFKTHLSFLVGNPKVLLIDYQRSTLMSRFQKKLYQQLNPGLGKV